MTSPISRPLAALAALSLFPLAAQAEPLQEWRCSTDSLNPGQATIRIERARKCGLLRNVLNPDAWFMSSRAFDASFQFAKDYKEVNTAVNPLGDKSFSGSSFQWNVNFYHAWGTFDATPIYSVAKETTGLTANYFKWSHTATRPRPLYPTFENTASVGTGTQLFPHPTNPDDCRLYSNPEGTGAPVANSSSFFVVAYCESSCFTPDQSVLFGGGEKNILDAMKQGREDIITLGPDSTLDDLQLQQGKVYSYTSETRDSEHVIFHVRTASGGELKVTNEHPVLTREGRMVQAQTLKAGDELLRQDGTPDAIVSVERGTHAGKVYNLKPEARDQVSNILVAQGFLVGSARFQNDDVEYMNRIILFHAVPAEALPD
ncbi:Hint domain-containing protein [Corallococcus sp. bb12-1]|uniref:Hint domain-containing protein n=1 Tax=Corallococcus sp. bb12-1 TaxID=2996784 RepID=UPI002271A287|nr:Hint domain-containing protein [Corallococcus sp. bb12-1]MCY1043788.1 Hint domain-containing protein [Corallococcus sp. bb12-1]